ncbi:alpha-2-macroglobulin family protein [Shimia sp. SDUM112013]|uniref:alpha-2-macroglobulin family protein n=1 Tax=Shimia sp. SDUM112013 TaxID=3136160 RepID=UPI0032EEE13D
MRWILAVLTVVFASQISFASESYIPERRAIISQDVDFYGSDLANIFDTSFSACRTACLNNPECKAFTFNARSNACFPKSEISDRQPYEGALSGEILAASKDLLDNAPSRALELDFLLKPDLTRAKDQAKQIGRLHSGGPWTTKAMLDAARDRQSQGDTLHAMRWIGGAVGKSDKSDLWLEYARLNQDLARQNNNDRAKYQDRALLSAINAYLRAQKDAERVSALATMAELLETGDRGRAALSALRLAESIQPRRDIQTALERAVAKYGFRISEHRTESNLANPRICAEFNEPLVKAGIDYATFVRLPDQRLAVEAKDRDICIEGVEHGGHYTVTFRRGLPAASGETLIKDIELTMYVRDRKPAVKFPERAYVLPRSADAGLPIKTVNTDSVDLTLDRVSDRNILRTMQESYFGNPLSGWQIRNFRSDVAETVWKGEADIGNDLNKDITTRLPLGDVVTGMPPGVYALTADLPGANEYDETSTTQWFVLSDLGVTTLSGGDGLHVFVRSLGTAEVKQGSKVTLFSRGNRVLGSATSDADGYVRFDPGLTRGTGTAAPALVTIENGDDFSFLSLTDAAFDLSDRGVEGLPPAPPVDVFLATDRGAYRAGETIFATALVRDEKTRAISGLPVTTILTRPDGVEYSRHVSQSDSAGGHVFQIPVGQTVPRGTWTLSVKSDPQAQALATQKVLIEDFLPERIDFEMSLPDGAIPAQSPRVPLTVSARYLFGAPGAGLNVEGQITLRARDHVEGYDGYVFGRYDERLSPRNDFFGGEQTDKNGVAEINLTLPEIDQSGLPLEAEIITRVLEGSGRPVERRMTHPVESSGPMIGIKPLFEHVVREGTEARFDLIALAPDLAAAPMRVRWTVNRVETRYQWYNLYGNWEWEPTTRRTRVAGGEAMLGQQPVTVSAPVEWGRYEVIVERLDETYVSSSSDFYAGWYAPADATETPDTLELSLDKSTYRSGEKATLRIVPRFSGTALVTVMSNHLIAMQAVEVSEGENLIPLDVTDEWGAGAYVTASVIRPSDVSAGQNPARALGLSYATIDPDEKQLSVTLDASEKMVPKGILDVSVQVDGANENTFVTLAAVDVGILNLTAFQSPNPSYHYFGQRRLGMEIRDIYGRLIDGLSGDMGNIRSGGDTGAGAQFQSPPPTEDLVAFFSGPVRVAPDGSANIQFDIPEFNGTVRLMAIAWSDTAVGQADREVLVRNPVVVTASVPRFLAPRDTSRLLLEITHADGPIGRVGLDVTATGVSIDTAVVPSGVDIAKSGTTRLSVPFQANEVGDHEIRIVLTTPDGKQSVKTLLMPVRANDPAISTTQRLTLAAGDTFTLDDNLFADLRDGTGQAVISAGALARFDVPGLLQSLDQYPYGCTEQVVSKALPLLYFEQVSSALDLDNPQKVPERLKDALSVVLSRQSGNGAFGLWYPDSGDFWLDAYVGDFLSRAKAEGYTIPDHAFRATLDNLRNRVNYAPDFDLGGEDIAYALMVLAREGAANMGDLRYYADVKADAFATPLAAAQLAAALAFYGDQTRADRMFRIAAQHLEADWDRPKTPVWRSDYGTRLRDAAGLLALAVEAGSDAVDRNYWGESIVHLNAPLSTQESAWSLLAAHALITDPATSQLSVNGTKVDGPLIRAMANAVASTPARIHNEGTKDTALTLTTIGVPDYTVDAGGYGYRIERNFFTTEGAVLALEDLRVGDRFVTVLKVLPDSQVGARLMVNDPLPAGFEIDNPNLLTSGDIRELNWLKLANAQNAEFRSDRFLAAVDWRSDQPFELAYIVRAVSPGEYHHPAATVEDMYRPQFRARTAASRVKIVE